MKKKRLRKVLFWVGVVLLVVSLAALVFALLPNEIALERILLDSTFFKPPGGLP